MINNKFILYLDLDGVLTSEDFIVYTHNCLTKHKTEYPTPLAFQRISAVRKEKKWDPKKWHLLRNQK